MMLVFLMAFSNLFNLLEIPFAHAANTQIRQEINITDSYLYAGSGSYATSSAIANLDPSQYTSGTYYFEIVASTTAGTSATISLVNATSSFVAASITINAGNTYTLYRSTVFTAPPVPTDYVVVLGNDSIGKGLIASRIVVLQNAATLSKTETQIEIGNDETYTSTATSTFSNPKYWFYDDTKWDGSPTFYAEVTYKAIAGVASTTHYTTAGTRTVVIPTGTASTTIELTASGGTGCGTTSTAGKGGLGGGGGGAYSKSTIGGLSGSHTLIIGAGVTGVNTAPAPSGNDSKWDTTVIVAKGGSGCPGTGNNTVGGAGGQASAGTGDVKHSGGSGGTGLGPAANSAGGGGGAGSDNDGGNGSTGTGGAGLGGTVGGGKGGAGRASSNTGLTGVIDGGGGGGAYNTTASRVGGSGAAGEATTTDYIATTTIALQVSNTSVITGDTTWSTMATIVGMNPVATSTRVRSASFSPTAKRYYRIAFANGKTGAVFAIYNAKIIIDQAAPTKIETQYLLANTLLPSMTGLQTLLTKWDSTEWSVGAEGIRYSLAVDAAANSSSVIEADTAAGGKINGSTVTAPKYQGTSTSMTMPASGNLDVKATVNNSDIYSARILAQVQPASVPDVPTALSATKTGAQVALVWTAPGYNGGSAVTNYKIYRGIGSSPASMLIATVGNVLTYNDQNIVPQTTYYYRVVATNVNGDSTYSNEVNTVAPNRTYINKPPNYLSTGNGLVGWWTFDGKDMYQNVADKSGNNNNGVLQFGTLGNVSTSSMQVAGKIGQGLKFDGVDDKISVADNDSLDVQTGDLTLSVWVNRKGNSLCCAADTFQAIIGKGDGGDTYAYELLSDDDGNVWFTLFDGDNNPTAITTNTPINVGSWHHVVGVYRQSDNTSALKIYIDGILTKTADRGSYTVALNNNSTVLFDEWPYQAATRGRFNGILDDVRIYNRALSMSEISQLYRAGSAKIDKSTVSGGLSTGLVGYWTFDGKDMYQNVADKSGNNNNGVLQFGTLGNVSTSSMQVAGKLGQGLKFDGQDDYITVPNASSQNMASNLSAFAWVKSVFNPLYTDEAEIMDKGAGWALGWALGWETYGDIGAIRMNGNFGGTFVGNINSAEIGLDIPLDGKWHLVGFTFDSNYRLIQYIDGVAGDWGIQPGALSGQDLVDLQIGASSGVSYSFFYGGMDDIRLYNRILSPAEVVQLYNIGKAKIKL